MEVEHIHALQVNTKGVVIGVMSGISGFASMCFLTRGLQMGHAGKGILVRSLTVPICAVAGWAALGERMGGWDVLGVFCVMASIAALAFR